MSKEKTQESHVPEKQAPVRKPQPKRRGFFATIFSHLAVAAIAVIGVGSYIHWDEILNYTGSRVCAYNVLGKYAIEPVKVPPIDLAKPATEPQKENASKSDDAASKLKGVEAPKDNEAKVEKVEEKPQQPVKTDIKADDAAEKKPLAATDKKAFDNALQAARKQFWENDKAAVEAYEDLVKKQPKNADLRAELANVYYKNGKTDKAIEMFFVAGKAFIMEKNANKAKGIVDVLKQVSPEKATELSKLINTATN